MKRNTLLKSITVSVALSAFLSGCGSTANTMNTGNDRNNNNDNTLKTSSISGKAVDGYLQFATVCLDMNQDGYCQATEPNTQTDENGSFSLDISSEIGQNPQFKTAMLLVYGGKDHDTGVDFEGKLFAPQDGEIINITPVSTLLAKTVQKDLEENPTLTQEEIKLKIQLAKQKVAAALDIPEEQLTDDPVKRFQNGDDELIKKSLQLQKYVEAFLVTDDNETKKERAEKIYDALAMTLDEMDDTQKGVDTLFDKTVEKAQNDKNIKALLGGEKGLELSDAARIVSDNIHTKFEQFDQNTRQEPDFLEKVAVSTEDDLNQITEAIKKGTIAQINEEIAINPEIFNPEFDWKAKFIKQDLLRIGISNPSDELIEKIKKLFDEKKIKPGILFSEKEQLSDTQDPKLEEIYVKINAIIQQKETHKAPVPPQTTPDEDNQFIDNKPQQDMVKFPSDKSVLPGFFQNQNKETSKENQKDNQFSNTTKDDATSKPDLHDRKFTQQEAAKESGDDTFSASTSTNTSASSDNTQEQSTQNTDISTNNDLKPEDQNYSVPQSTTEQEDSSISQNISSAETQDVSDNEEDQSNPEAVSQNSANSGNQNSVDQEEMPTQNKPQNSAPKTEEASGNPTDQHMSKFKY